MSSDDELMDDSPPSVADPYEVLGIDRSASAGQVKSAYRKAALRTHPDKAGDDKKDEAHQAFQEVAFAYAVLSDPARRKRYDETGSTAESVVDADGFDWTDFYRAAFKDAVSSDAIEQFSEQYKQSDEERDDLLSAYKRGKGDMDVVYEMVMLSDVLEDDERFRSIIDEAIGSGEVPSFKKYTDETDASKKARKTAARNEGKEAEEYARELGVADKLWGKGDSDEEEEGESTEPPKKKTRAEKAQARAKAQQAKGKGKGKSKAKDDQAGLAALIQKRQQDRAANFLDGLAEKYGANAQKKSKNGKKRAVIDDDEEEEPSEEAFQAAAARLQNNKPSKKKTKK